MNPPAVRAAATPGRLPAEPTAPTARRLRVDPIACEAVGLCTHLAPSLIELDRWGYPIVPVDGLSPDQVPAAERAVRACPRRALWLE